MYVDVFVSSTETTHREGKLVIYFVLDPIQSCLVLAQTDFVENLGMLLNS